MTMPTGFEELATKTDLRHLEERINVRFEALDHRFAALDYRFEAIGHQFEALEQKLTARLADGLRDQTRTFIVWMFMTFTLFSAVVTALN